MALKIYRGYQPPFDMPDDHVVSIVVTQDSAEYVLPEELKEKYAHISEDRLRDSLAIYTDGGNPPVTPSDWAEVAMYNLNDLMFEEVDVVGDYTTDMFADAVDDELGILEFRQREREESTNV